MPRGRQMGRGRAQARRGRQGRGAGLGRGRGRGKARPNRGKAVNTFLRPHTGREAGKIANAQAGVEFNPEIRQLRQDAKGSRKREMDLGAWFGELAQDYADAQTAGQQAFQATQDNISKQLAEASARGTEQLTNLSKEDAEFAKLVGGPTDAKGLSQIAQAASAAERARVSLNAPTAKEGANFLAALGGYRAAARMQGIESRRSEQRRRDKIRSDLGATRREKGLARVANKERIREADRAERSQRVSERLAKREFTDPKPYDEAILSQAQMGLEGDLASANAQTGSASIYAGADRRTATATERAARQARRGREATARGQVKTAGIYGKGGGSGGYNKREAQALLSSAGKNFKNSQAAVNYLVNRGVKIGVARAAVKAAVGGGGGGRSKRPSGYQRAQHAGRVPQPGVPRGPRQTVKRRKRR